MGKQEYMAMSLPTGLKLMQSRKKWFIPENDRIVTLVGLSEYDGLMPEQYDNIPTHINVFYRVDANCTGNGEMDDFKPVCHTTADLVREIEHKGEKFVPYKKLGWSTYDGSIGRLYDFGDCHKDIIDFNNGLSDALKLIEWHFAIGLDETDYVDVNTLEINPYKINQQSRKNDMMKLLP